MAAKACYTDGRHRPIPGTGLADVAPRRRSRSSPGRKRTGRIPPFSGDRADGFIWGRGALDVKCGAIGLLEAAERLLENGFRPAGDVYFALRAR